MHRITFAAVALLAGSLFGTPGAVMAPANAATSHHAAPDLIGVNNPCYPLDWDNCHLVQFTGATSKGAVAPRGAGSATPDVLNCMFGYGSQLPCTSRGIHTPTNQENGYYGWSDLEWKAASTSVWNGLTSSQFSVGAWDQRYANVEMYIGCSYGHAQHSYVLATVLAGPTRFGRRVSTNVPVPCQENGQKQDPKPINITGYLAKIIPPSAWFSRDWHATVKINWVGGKVAPDVSVINLNTSGGTFDPDPEVVHTSH